MEQDRRNGSDIRAPEAQIEGGDRHIEEEDRSAPRRRMLKGVRISFNNEFSFLDAVLRNLSETGCFIELPDGYLIPDTITIHNDLDGYKVDCEVVRRQGNRIGVKFVGEKIPVVVSRKQVLTSISNEQPNLVEQSHSQPGVTPVRAPQRRKGRVFGKLGTPR